MSNKPMTLAEAIEDVHSPHKLDLDIVFDQLELSQRIIRQQCDMLENARYLIRCIRDGKTLESCVIDSVYNKLDPNQLLRKDL